MSNNLQLGDIQSPRKDFNDLIVLKERNGVKLVENKSDRSWEILGISHRYQYKSSKWAENRFAKIMKIKERD